MGRGRLGPVTVKCANAMDESAGGDSVIIQRVLAGDSEAFSELVARHGQVINNQMRNYGGDAGAAEELAHEVFVEAFLNLAKFRGDAPFGNWLSRIATCVGIRHWKNRDKRKKFVEFSEARDSCRVDEARDEAARTADKDPERAKTLAYDLLAALPDTDRLVLTLAYLEGCSHDEISARTGWRKPLIAMRIFKAKGKLRKLAAKEPWKGKIRWLTS